VTQALRLVWIAASVFWDISPVEYMERADVWPLNPRGDLLAIMMIETAESVRKTGHPPIPQSVGRMSGIATGVPRPL
jgi:hypothetical protein